MLPSKIVEMAITKMVDLNINHKHMAWCEQDSL
jgi:hypothetical protein